MCKNATKIPIGHIDGLYCSLIQKNCVRFEYKRTVSIPLVFSTTVQNYLA